MLLSAVTGLYFGTFVDRRKKKMAMLYSSVGPLVAYVLAAILYLVTLERELLDDLVHSDDEVCLACQLGFHYRAHRPVVLEQDVDSIAGTELVFQLELG